VSSAITFALNGKVERITELDPHTTLLTFLRARGLTAAKEGCGEGECGACAVVFEEHTATGKAFYASVNACLVLLPALEGRSLWTVEGMGTKESLHPVQAALVEASGSQCGYCTPGFVASLFAHYYQKPRGDVREALSGNLCRCTGYRPILEAAHKLGTPAPDDPFVLRLREPAHEPASLRYLAHAVRVDRPRDLDEALALREAYPEADIVAGGTDAVVEVNRDGTRSDHLIMLDGVAALRTLEEDDAQLTLGAGLTFAELARELRGQVPLFDQLFPLFASLPVRARATLGGNLVTGSPVGDSAPVLLALDAVVELASSMSQRAVPIARFFTGYRQTAVWPQELLVAVRIPRAQPTHARFYKVAKRALDDISSVAAAFALTVEQGVISKARLAFGGVAPTPVRAFSAEAMLVGQPLSRGLAAAIRGELEGTFAPIDDHRASAAYRRALVTSLWDKFAAEVLP
jgi:xanthine dehydrogenase small subunit